MYSLRYPLRRLSLPERIPGGIEVWLLEFDIGLSVPRDDEAYESTHDFPPVPMAMQRPWHSRLMTGLQLRGKAVKCRDRHPGFPCQDWIPAKVGLHIRRFAISPFAR